MAMYLALAAAASTALDLVSSLAASKSAPAKSATSAASRNSNPFSVTPGTQASPAASTATSNWGQSGALSSDTWNALLASQSPSANATSRSGAMKDLFAQIDVNGDGSLSKSEFEQRLGAGGTNVAAADDVFAKLDTDGNGSVSINELTSALQTRKSGGSHHARGGHGGGLADALTQSVDGATTATTRNADGSTTTTLTYADGSKVTSTSAASNAGSASAASSYNLIEKLIQSQSQAVSNSASPAVKV